MILGYIYFTLKIIGVLLVAIYAWHKYVYEKETKEKKMQELKEYFYGDKDIPPPLDLLK